MYAHQQFQIQIINSTYIKFYKKIRTLKLPYHESSSRQANFGTTVTVIAKDVKQYSKTFFWKN